MNLFFIYIFFCSPDLGLAAGTDVAAVIAGQTAAPEVAVAVAEAAVGLSRRAGHPHHLVTELSLDVSC